MSVVRICVLVLGSLILLACSIHDSQTSKNQASHLTSQESQPDTFTVQLLGINDFHGQIPAIEDGGGMVNLARHLLHAIESTDEHTFVLHAGDHVGASPAESALLQDEPAIDFLNILQQNCVFNRDATCHVLGTAGNHEFDEGSDEMLRLLKGGNHAKGPFIQAPWRGSTYQTLSANVVAKETSELLLEPYAIHEVNGILLGFIGITLDITPELVVPGMVENLVFNNQAQAVSYYVKALQRQGVESIVVVVHDGSQADYYPGQTQLKSGIPMDSRFGQFLKQLPDAVDVVVSGHSHRFTNAYVKNDTGKTILVTQAFANGRAYADISVTIDTASRDVVTASAEVIYANKVDATLSDSGKAALVKIQQLEHEASRFAKAYTQRVINRYAPTEDEIPLGQFIADSHRYSLNTDLGIMNRGGVRAALEPGVVTWGELFAIQPFNNALVVRRYTAEQLAQLLETRQFWSSNLIKTDSEPARINGDPVDQNRSYTVAGNAYIMNSEQFAVGELVTTAGIDVESTIKYIKLLPTPFNLSDTPTVNNNR